MFVKQTGILLLFLLSYFKILPSSAVRPIKNANKTDVRSNKIVGGYRCPITKVPFLVSLRHLNKPEHLCAGSLLSEFWILTALHCLEKTCRWTIEVIAGSSYAYDPRNDLHNEKLQVSTIAQCYFYPIVDSLKFDIALARLREPIRQTDNVAYVLLPFKLPSDKRKLIDICSNATVAGWGTQYASDIYGEPISPPVPEHDPHLQCVHLPVISTKDCNNRSHTTVLSTFFCTFQKMTTSCYGDSGGPLLCNGYQYGIVSHGFACAYKQFPAVFTNILYFKNFILTTMESPLITERSFGEAIRVTVELNVVLVILVFGIIHIY